MALQHLRSGTANKRPLPTAMSDGQLAVNTNLASPGLFFKDGNGDLVKVGPVHIGSTAPNASPASTAATALVANTIYQILTVGTSDFTAVGAGSNAVGVVFTASGTTTGTGTVSGQQGNEKGEMWLDNTGGSYVFKIYDGTAWRSEVGEFVNATGDTMTGDLLFNNANIVFEGSAADDHETTLTVVNPTADRTITLPNVTGTVVTTGDTGSVTSTMLTDGTIVNADVNASAAIAGTKVSPDFGSQAITTTGIINANGKVSFPLGSAAAPSLLPGSDTNTGIFSPGADSLAITTAGTQRVTVDSSGNVGIGTSSPSSFGKFAIRSHAGTIDAVPNVSAHIADGSNSALYIGHSSGLVQLVANSALSFGYTNGSTNSERLRIDSSGNVGIGASSPSVTNGNGLHIASINAGLKLQNTVNTGVAYVEYADESNTTKFVQGYRDLTGLYAIRPGASLSATSGLTLDSSGNVGIGTASIDASLHVKGVGTHGTFVLEAGGASGASNQIYIQGHNNAGTSLGELHFEETATNQGAIVFKTNGGSVGERLRIDSSGKVGIGTSSPTTKCVISNGGAEGLEFGHTSGTNEVSSYNRNTSARAPVDIIAQTFEVLTGNPSLNTGLFQDSSGKVGIGTTSPSTPLTVSNGGAEGFEVSLGGRVDFQAYNRSGSAYIDLKDACLNRIFATGGTTERMRIDSSGNVGIGTSSPSVSHGNGLHIASANAGLKLQNTVNTGWAYVEFTDESNTTKYIQGYRDSTGLYAISPGDSLGVSSGLTLDSSGNVGIGTSSPSTPLHIKGAADCYLTLQAGATDGNNGILFQNSAGTQKGVIFFDTDNDYMFFSTNNTERMRINSSGQILMNCTSQIGGGYIQHLKINSGTGGIAIQNYGSSNTAMAFRNSANNSTVGSIVTSNTLTTYNTSSDYRLKENVVDIADGITRVKQLSPRRFNFIADDTTTVDGFIAHEAQTVVPEAVTGTHNEVDDDGNAVMQGIDQSKLVPLLTAALQEAIAKIETLEQRLSDAGIA